jgi:cell division protein FtsA
MARQIVAGIDIGTSSVKVVIAEEILQNDRLVPRIIGTGLSESRGLHHGYIVSQPEVSESIRQAVASAEKMAGQNIKRAFVSIGGIGLSSVTTTGSSIVSRADLEITPLDLDKAQEAAETAIPHAQALNKKIINTIPIEYKTDGKVVWGRIQGLKAQKIDAKVLFIMCLDHHLQDLIKAVEEANIEVIDVVAAPIASSFVSLSKKQKNAGCVLANIGAETISIAVFENNTPISLEVFPIGGNDITNDIALGLKVPLEQAESIKLGAVTGANFSKKKLDEIVSARLSDMFELIESHLKKIGRNALLPAGIILTGGSSNLGMMKSFAEQALKLPSTSGAIHFGEQAGNEPNSKTKDNSWSTAYGLAVFGFNAEGMGPIKNTGLGSLTGHTKHWFRSFTDWIGQFLP